MESFSLVFRASPGDEVGHDTYRMKHEKLGEFDLFIGPVMYGKQDGVYYQAVFNRLG